MRKFKRFAMGSVLLAALLSVSTSAAQAAVPTAPYNVLTFEEDSNGHAQVDAVAVTNFSTGVEFSGTDEWGNVDSIGLQAPTGSQLTVGTFGLVGGISDATHVGFSTTQGSSGCTSGTGSITIAEVVRDGSQNITAFAATYSFTCGIQQTQYGAIRFNSSLGFVAASEIPWEVNFGEHYLGQFTPATLTITNTGSQALVMGQMQKSGDHTASFAITTDTCSGQSLAAGDSCAITVHPEPTGPGSGSLHFQIPDNSPIGYRYGTFFYQADYSYIGAFRTASGRILDTRHGIGAPTHAVGAGQTITLQVGGRGAIPDTGVSAAVMNLTVTNTHTSGFLTMYPHGTPRPTASNINFTSGTTRANTVTVALSASGAVDIYNGSAGNVDIIVDSSGYFAGVDTTLPASAYHPVIPGRILDTRHDGGGPLPAGFQLFLPFTFNHPGGPDIDSHVSAVAFNITAVSPTAPGYLSADGGSTSLLNFATNQTVPNMAVLHTDHCLSAQCLNMPFITISNFQTTGSTHVLVDVFGYFDDSSLDNGLRFHAISPVRITDTRINLGAPPLGSGQTATITPAASLIGSETVALGLNVTAVNPSAATFLTVWPGGTRPNVSTLNPAAHQTVANGTIALLSNVNTFNVFNGTGETNLVIDLAGTYDLYPFSQTQTNAAGLNATAQLGRVLPSGGEFIRRIQ